LELQGGKGCPTKVSRRVSYIRADLIIMPLLVAGFFMLSLDRSNIANAVTDTILQDVHITINDVNIRYQLLSLGIVIFEIPSNIILQKVPPRTLFC
jgi:hypothetical protein